MKDYYDTTEEAAIMAEIDAEMCNIDDGRRVRRDGTVAYVDAE